MTTKNAVLSVARQEPQGTTNGKGSLNPEPTNSLPHLPPDVKALRDFIQRRHIPMIDLVEVVRTLYPRCEKALLSKCAHGEETGAMLRPDALKALMVRFAEDGRKAPNGPRRRKPNRCVCRVTDAVYRVLTAKLQRTGQTVQDYLEALILRDLEVRQDGTTDLWRIANGTDD